MKRELKVFDVAPFGADTSTIAKLIPMKRELKDEHVRQGQFE